MGPEAGKEGGKVVASGPPNHVAKIPESHTGRFLAEILG
jgi:excinuclease ABC subunit A